MDVTFNNVLEGARQYFQGLPTATCSSANASYPVSGEHQINHYGMEQRQEKTPTSSALSYWPPHPESQLRTQSHGSSQNSDVEAARLSSQNQNVTQLQEHHQTSSNYHPQFTNQEQPVPTTHSYPYNNRVHSQQQQPQHVSQYQSHIISNPSYHQTPTSQQPQTAPPATRVHDHAPSQNYHQLQLQSQTEQSYTNYQQSRSYYSGHAQTQQQPQSYHPYQTASTQAYSQPSQPSYSNQTQTYNAHSQNSYATDNYSTVKTTQPSQETVAKDKHLNQNQPTSQPYRATHNLPPIAALSNVNYHSNRSRDVIRAAGKTRPIATTVTTSSYPTKPVADTPHLARTPTNYSDYINSMQKTRPVVTQSYQYCSSSQPSNTHPQYNVSTQQTIHQSSNSTYTSQEVKPYQPHSAVNQNVTHSSNNSGITSVIKQKRESPLDLSVKTVRTSADSTLDDVEEAQRLSKYYHSSRQPIHSSAHVPASYATYNLYSNSSQRSLTSKSGAPKVDFSPNFSMPSLGQQMPTNKVDGRRMTYDQSNRQSYERKGVYQPSSARNPRGAPIAAHGSTNPALVSTLGSNGIPNPAAALNNSIMQASAKKPIQGLPRIDFLPPNKSIAGQSPSVGDVRKRNGETVSPMVPSKIPKVDMWRQTIDQQIEQKLSSYTKSKYQQEQTQKLSSTKLVNGNLGITSQDQNTYQRPNYTSPMYTYNNNAVHNQTYVPTPVMTTHQYPSYPNHGSQHAQQALYPQHSIPRASSNPCLPVTSSNKTNVGGAADRRVLSLLRNSLEIKGAKEARKKLEQEQQQIPSHHIRTDIQHPSTDVMAPLQPKPGVVGRHNMSPFAATSLFEQSTNTHPSYKFHLPKAMDSIKLEGQENKDARIPEKIIKNNADGNLSISNTNTDLDGLAAFLAARIRTKAELKQVGSAHNAYQSGTINELTRSVSESQLCNTKLIMEPQSNSSLKSMHEQFAPRRKLFTKTEGDLPHGAPPRDKTGLRSSSETSVFDFPDSDSETEMPVLERQSLVDMRKDRKVAPKSIHSSTELLPNIEFIDTSFDSVFDNFVEQLKARVVKKRGRRKKVFEPEILAKLEDATKDKVADDIKTPIKLEPKEEKSTKPLVRMESESDSDVPLINCLKPKLEIKETIKAEFSDAESDREVATTMSKTLPEKTADVKNELVKRTPAGDGNDFYPGWEEEVYNYKRSLRMPAALIHVTRPPHWHRLSTSLPDLDAHTISPSPFDNSDIKPKLESEFDSEVDTSFSLTKTREDSEDRSSVTSVPASTPKPKSNSILARLIERCGTRKRRKPKKKPEDNLPKIIPKSKSPMGLLPTPGLEIESFAKDSKSSELIIKEESALLGFSKKSIDNFKDAFINKSNNLMGINEQFKTVVMKSRTRLETRTLKQKATIKEVFGDDRPASAPPVSCVNTEHLENVINKDQLNKFENATDTALENVNDSFKIKLPEQKGNDSMGTKKSISGFTDDDFIIKDDCKSETPSVDGDDYITPAKKRMKYIRRKFSSGFDYIRKKKKLIKKECSETDSNAKPKRRPLSLKASPESIQDIQKEIKSWVLNKGIGETHLHRAARCGYTDIAAFFLEKMEWTPSPKDNAGYTPLHEACANGNLATAKLLLLYGANPSESGRGGVRPLHDAAENGNVEIVRLLLSYGADPLLASYSGVTPLSIAAGDATRHVLQNHIAEIQGQRSDVWNFLGPAMCFDPEESGFNPLENAPNSDCSTEEEDNEFELSNFMLPNLYTIRGESQSDHWVLLQDLSHILKIKSKETLLKQICPVTLTNSTNTNNYKSVLRELKISDFLERATCCQYLCAGEKINTRASKVALVKYSDKVRQLLGVEKCIITVR